MEKYYLLARVNHKVTDVVTLTVEAESQSAAFEKAKQVLEIFPRPQDMEGVPYCYIEHRYYDNTEVAHIEEMTEGEDA
jgi:hypothetical protein